MAAVPAPTPANFQAEHLAFIDAQINTAIGSQTRQDFIDARINAAISQEIIDARVTTAISLHVAQTRILIDQHIETNNVKVKADLKGVNDAGIATALTLNARMKEINDSFVDLDGYLGRVKAGTEGFDVKLTEGLENLRLKCEEFTNTNA